VQGNAPGSAELLELQRLTGRLLARWRMLLGKARPGYQPADMPGPEPAEVTHRQGQAAARARLLPLAHTVVFTRPQLFRAAEVDDLAARARSYNLEGITVPPGAGAIRGAQDLAGPKDRIVVSGSLYTVGEAKEYFEGVVGGPKA
jgi:hypothetical protein